MTTSHTGDQFSWNMPLNISYNRCNQCGGLLFGNIQHSADFTCKGHPVNYEYNGDMAQQRLVNRKTYFIEHRNSFGQVVTIPAEAESKERAEELFHLRMDNGCPILNIKDSYDIAEEMSDHLMKFVRKSFVETKARLGAENKITMEDKIKQLEREIASYKKICTMADVPQILIDNPTLIECSPLTHKDIELASTWVKEYEERKKRKA